MRRVLDATTGPAHPCRTAALEALVALYERWGRPDRADEVRRQIAAP